MSELEKKLKRIVRAHPGVRLHPHSPSGPYVRAVMWEADGGILGQALQEPDGAWVVRAGRLPLKEHSLVVVHPKDLEGIGGAITGVLARLAAA